MPVSPDGSLTLQIEGEDLVLLGERALYWPARERLIIADLHLGKDHVFRQLGIAVPRGATRDDLHRLSALIGTTAAKALWIVGDVLHGPIAQAEWHDTWTQWRQSHDRLEVAALSGNHDRALNGADLGLRELGASCCDGPFVFRHLPQADAQGRHVIAGHIHPKARVPGVPRQWPAFWLQAGMTVLPAFSAFTGGQLVPAQPGHALAVCVEGAVLWTGS